ncbi:MAG: YbaK/EbsC family protein [Geminicoccaceae bacterium]
MSAAASASVGRVRAALEAAGSPAAIVELAETARSAEDAARAVGCPLGAIVKSLVFAIDGRPVMVLVAGDRRCDTAALPAAFGIEGKARRADADLVREATGFAIGGVAPVGHSLPVVVDASLRRFAEVWAAAGHPHCVFRTTPDELLHLTDGRENPAVGMP